MNIIPLENSSRFLMNLQRECENERKDLNERKPLYAELSRRKHKIAISVSRKFYIVNVALLVSTQTFFGKWKKDLFTLSLSFVENKYEK